MDLKRKQIIIVQKTHYYVYGMCRNMFCMRKTDTPGQRKAKKERELADMSGANLYPVLVMQYYLPPGL